MASSRPHPSTIEDDLKVSDSEEEDTILGCNPNVKYTAWSKEEEDRLLADDNDDDDEASSETRTAVANLLLELHAGNRDRERANTGVADTGNTKYFTFEQGGSYRPSASSSKVVSDMRDMNIGESSQGTGNRATGSHVVKNERMETAHEVDFNPVNRNRTTAATTTNPISNQVPRRNESRKIMNYEDVAEDLDEICHRRNIVPPQQHGEAQQRHRFGHDNDRPITETRKMLNVDPREVSLDEVIAKNKCFQEVPVVGRGRGGYKGRGRGWMYHQRGNSNFQRLLHPQQVSNRGHAHHHHHGQKNDNDKLKRGLEEVVKTDTGTNVLGNVLSSDNENTSEFPKYVPQPWNCISHLNESGYGTYYVLKKLKEVDNVDEKLQERMFRCTIEYEGISGICEATQSYQARHGAASDFLKKLCQQLPKVGSMPTKVPDEVLMDASALTKLKDKLKELRKVDYTTSFQYVNLIAGQGRPIFKCIMDIEPYKYEGYSYQNITLARLNAIKKAYEDLIRKPYPYARIYVGERECTTDPAMYRDVESRKVHCYDLSQTNLQKPGTFQQRYGMGERGRGGSHRARDRNVMVSFEQPEG